MHLRSSSADAGTHTGRCLTGVADPAIFSTWASTQLPACAPDTRIRPIPVFDSGAVQGRYPAASGWASSPSLPTEWVPQKYMFSWWVGPDVGPDLVVTLRRLVLVGLLTADRRRS